MREPWLSNDDPFNLTATGYLGRKRDEMLQNELLSRAPLGGNKLRGTQIPARIKTFGDNYRCPWSMGHALRGWAGTFPSPKEISRKKKRKLPTDFLQLNRACITAGMLTCPDVYSFRKSKQPIKRDQYATERPLPKPLPIERVYGKPLAPCDPIKDVLGYTYQREWLMNNKREVKQAKAPKIDFTKGPRPNRASMLRPLIVKPGLQSEPWRARKFVDNAKPHLSTFRSEEELHAAHAANAYESIGRRGQAGQGVEWFKVHEHALPPIVPEENKK